MNHRLFSKTVGQNVERQEKEAVRNKRKNECCLRKVVISELQADESLMT